MDNGIMFIFIGLVLALVQGGFVRRKAAVIGEKKMSLYGLICITPGLLILGKTGSVLGLYGGLTFLAIGSAMTIPCLTALVSLYTPANEQGRAIGLFRSLGALSRVIGPLLAAIVYWKVGSAYPYYFGSLFLLIPIFLISRCPQPQSDI
jgi:MFS family permease